MAERLRRGLWTALLVLLPITSMPLIRDWIGSSAVASPSILPLAGLLVFWLAPYMLRGGRLPGQARPLLGFLGAALFTALLAFFRAAPAYKDQSIVRQELEAFITLAVGLSYYFVAATFLRDHAQIKTTLRWIALGGALIVLWSGAQAVAWFGFGRYPDWMRDLQDLISLGPMYRQRVTGFAIEPSWLAHQMNMLYLPFWLAASVTRSSAFSRRFGPLIVEDGLLAGGALTLALSFSRVGYAAFLVAVTFLFLTFNAALVRRVRARLLSRSLSRSLARPRLLTAALVVSLLVIYLLALAGGLYAFSRIDPRMAEVFQISRLADGGFLAYANQLQFGERAIYWQTGWNIFNDYPVLGVGLGNAGFYFPAAIPAYGWNMIEVRRLLFRGVELANIKNLWVRLLAETGLLGFALFAAWLFVVLQTARWLRRSPAGLQRAVGLAGIFVLLGLIFEGFSIDSFALPYFWISLGLVTAVSRLDDHSNSAPTQQTRK